MLPPWVFRKYYIDLPSLESTSHLQSHRALASKSVASRQMSLVKAGQSLSPGEIDYLVILLPFRGGVCSILGQQADQTAKRRRRRTPNSHPLFPWSPPSHPLQSKVSKKGIQSKSSSQERNQKKKKKGRHERERERERKKIKFPQNRPNGVA